MLPPLLEDPVLLDAERERSSPCARDLERPGGRGAPPGRLAPGRPGRPRAPELLVPRPPREPRDVSRRGSCSRRSGSSSPAGRSTYEDLDQRLGEPVSAVPARAGPGAERRRLVAREPARHARPARRARPRRASRRSRAARRRRRPARATAFTEYDGWVPEAGPVLDPGAAGRRGLGDGLERLAGCPFRHFLERGLGVGAAGGRRARSGRVARSADARLGPPRPLRALHAGAAGARRAARPGRHGARLRELGERGARRRSGGDAAAVRPRLRAGARGAPPRPRPVPPARGATSPGARPSASRSRSAASAAEGEPLARAEPVTVDLGAGLRFRLRGRIDRIDRLADGSYEVVDYKTGRYWPDGLDGHVRGRPRAPARAVRARRRRAAAPARPGARVAALLLPHRPRARRARRRGPLPDPAPGWPPCCATCSRRPRGRLRPHGRGGRLPVLRVRARVRPASRTRAPEGRSARPTGARRVPPARASMPERALPDQAARDLIEHGARPEPPRRGGRGLRQDREPGPAHGGGHRGGPLRGRGDGRRHLHAQGGRRAAGALPARPRAAARRRRPIPTGGERLETALARLERLFAGTIHAFCAHLLRERPVEAGVAPGFTELDDLEDDVQRRAAWRGYLRARARGGLAGVRRAPRRRPRAEGPGRRVRDRLPLPRGRVPARRRADARPRARAARARAVLAAARAAPAAAPIPPGATCEVQRRARELRAPAPRRRPRAARPSWPTLLARWDGAPRLVRKWWPRAPAPASRRRWSPPSRERRSRPSSPRGGSYCYRLGAALPGRRPRDAAEARRRAITLNYEDLLQIAARLLRERADVRARSSRSTAGSSSTSSRTPTPSRPRSSASSRAEPPPGRRPRDWTRVPLRPGALFVVGDPKQSIYRFRRADIETYGRVRARIEATGGARSSR